MLETKDFSKKLENINKDLVCVAVFQESEINNWQGKLIVRLKLLLSLWSPRSLQKKKNNGIISKHW